MAHATLWTRCWSVAAVLGFAVSLLLWGPAIVLVVWAVAALFASLILVGLSTSPGHASPAADLRKGRLVGHSALIGAGAVAIIATADITPVLALVLILVAGASSPWASGRFRTWLAPNAAPTARADDTGPLAPDGPSGRAPLPVMHNQTSVQQLSDDELCHEWRKSFLILKGAHFQGEFARVVAVRRLLLDEMERRNPSALNAWLSSGARAAGGPERYLHAQRRRGPSQAA